MAPANPWIFRQIEQYVGSAPADLRSAGRTNASAATQAVTAPGNHKLYDEPTETDRYQMIRTYFQMLIEEEMAGTEGKMKQFASWFTHGVPGGAGLRKAIYDAKSGPEILGRVEEFFESRLQMPEETIAGKS
jgi:tRNA-dihydrouridine synthase B